MRSIAIRSAVQAGLLVFVLTLLGGSVTWHFHERVIARALVPWVLNAVFASAAFPLLALLEERARARAPSVRRDAVVAALALAIAGVALVAAPLQASYARESIEGKAVESGFAGVAVVLARFVRRPPGAWLVHFLPALPFAIVTVGRVRRLETIRLLPPCVLVALVGAIAVNEWRHAFPSREDARAFQGVVLVLGLVLPLFGFVADRSEERRGPGAS